MWIDNDDPIPHTQYMLFVPENNEPELDKELPAMVEASLNETYSQFFFLNSIPKNKTMYLLKMLKDRDYINDENTDTIFFKLNVFNPNLKRLAQV